MHLRVLAMLATLQLVDITIANNLFGAHTIRKSDSAFCAASIAMVKCATFAKNSNRAYILVVRCILMRKIESLWFENFTRAQTTQMAWQRCLANKWKQMPFAWVNIDHTWNFQLQTMFKVYGAPTIRHFFSIALQFFCSDNSAYTLILTRYINREFEITTPKQRQKNANASSCKCSCSLIASSNAFTN